MRYADPDGGLWEYFSIDGDPVMLEIRNAVQAEEAVIEQAVNPARKGAALAHEVGLEAESLVVADDVSVASTLLRVVRDPDERVARD